MAAPQVARFTAHTYLTIAWFIVRVRNQIESCRRVLSGYVAAEAEAI